MRHLSLSCLWRRSAGRVCGPAFLSFIRYGSAIVIAFYFLIGTFVAHAEGAQGTLAWTADVTASNSQRDVCATLSDGVRVRIEKLKSLSRDWSSKIRSGQGSDASEKMRDERRTIKDLNAMLQGIGCKSLDIEYELTQPPKPVPAAPAAAKLKVGHHHKS